MTPPGDQMVKAFQSSMAGRTSIDECIQRNMILQNNGGPCIKQLCRCIGGAASQFGCRCCNVSKDDLDKIQKFCGGYGTSGFYNNGAYWYRTPEAQVLAAPPTYTGPTPGANEVGGMYQPVFEIDKPPYDN